MELYNTIPPEIKDDELYNHIFDIVKNNQMKTIIEIGSSSGMGSTKAIIEGIRQNTNNKENMKVFCLEASRERCINFKRNYEHLFYSNFSNIYLFHLPKYGSLYLYNYSSIGLNQYLSDNEIRHFYDTIKTNLNQYPIEEVLKWKQEEINYVKSNKIPLYGLQTMKQHHDLKHVDLVIFDGSAFCGMADFMSLCDSINPKWIIFDDINDIKNHEANQFINTFFGLSNIQYTCYALNLGLRNGFSIYKRINV